MNYFNFENIGKKVAIIESTDKKINGKIISISDDPKVKKKLPKLELDEKNGSFFPYNDPAQDRSLNYIYGPSGSGKSTLAKDMIQIWKKTHPTHRDNVYLFSAKPQDKALDSIGIKRIPINQNLIDNPITIEDCANSMIVFDDTDSLADLELKDAVYATLNSVLQIGRSYKISAIITNHLPLSGKFTKITIFESHSVSYFPHAGGTKRQTEYMLKEYVGLDKSDIAKIKKLKNTRWAFISKVYPMFALTRQNMFLLDQD